MRLLSRFYKAHITMFMLASLIWLSVLEIHAIPVCKKFQAIGQASIPTSTRLAATDRWGGPLFAKLDDEFLLGVISGDDGIVMPHGSIGQGVDGSYTVGFGCVMGTPLWVCTDTFTIRIPLSTFDTPPPVFGDFRANSAYVLEGTGRFQTASGNLNFGGPFIVWPVAGGPPPFNGRFNAELSGNICGVQ